jgi:hypothetical protein
MTNNRTKGRVVIPNNVTEFLALATKIYAKHLADGAASPLNSLEDFKWADLGPIVPDTLKHHTDAEFHKGEAEKEYRERDKTLPDLLGIVRASSTLLKGVYAKNPKKLADWGLSVDDSPKAKKSSDKTV